MIQLFVATFCCLPESVSLVCQSHLLNSLCLYSGTTSAAKRTNETARLVVRYVRTEQFVVFVLPTSVSVVLCDQTQANINICISFRQEPSTTRWDFIQIHLDFILQFRLQLSQPSTSPSEKQYTNSGRFDIVCIQIYMIINEKQ